MHASLPDIAFDTELLLERAGDGPTRDEVLNLLAGIAFREGNYERGVEEVWAVARATLAEFGAVGLAAVAVELSLQLASALERIATQQQIAAVDLAEVWFVD